MPASTKAFSLQFTPDAIDDIRQFRKHQQRQILDGIEARLTHQPAEETRNSKKLRPNALAEWELRLGEFRVFYDVDDQQRTVRIEVVGRKAGNRLYVRGKEYRL